MIFKTGTYEIIKILKKTTAAGFKNLVVGDKLTFSINLIRTTGARNGNYALSVKTTHFRDHPYMVVKYDLEPNPTWTNSQNNFVKRITNFELLEVL